MKANIENPKSALKGKPSAEEIMARTIRAKNQQGLTLTTKERIFFEEQQKQNWEDDNPRYGH